MLLHMILCGLALLVVSQTCIFAQDRCVRFPAGSTISDPENLYSENGVLTVDFTYQTSQDSYGFTRYCFVNSDGAQSPTLHVHPGDTLVLTLTNLVPEQAGKVPATMVGMDMSKAGDGGCGATTMTASSVNLHYHGTNTAPICHEDEAIHTIINSGETFRYEVHFPKNEPPGLYWYHPHIHGIATPAVQGGATGAIIVEGIENVNPAVAGLPQRVIMIRDNPAASPVDGGPPPEAAKYDLSVNYIPVGSPAFIPAVLPMKPGEKQFWRIVNSAAVTVLDLKLVYDGKPQTLELISLDGVPDWLTGWQWPWEIPFSEQYFPAHGWTRGVYRDRSFFSCEGSAPHDKKGGYWSRRRFILRATDFQHRQIGNRGTRIRLYDGARGLRPATRGAFRRIGRGQADRHPQALFLRRRPVSLHYCGRPNAETVSNG